MSPASVAQASTIEKPASKSMTDQSSTPGGVLEKPAYHTPAVITTPEDFVRSRALWQQEQYHVLCPAVNMSGIAQSHGLVASVVRINPDPAAGEVYIDKLFCDDEKGEVALAKIGLSKIMQCAGITVLTERTDPRTIPHYWEMRATGRWRGFDGAIQEIQQTVEYDLRDGAMRIRSFTPKQIMSARAHGLRGCEARAVNAVIRAFGIKQKYTKDELKRPFVVVRVMFIPDMTNPAIAAIVAQQALAGVGTLYGPSRPSVQPPVIDAVAEDPEPAPTGSSTSPASPPAASEPSLPEYARFVAKVESKTGTTNGRKWVRSTVILTSGEELVTFDTKVVELAEECAAKKLPVEVLDEVNERYPDQKTLVELKVIDTRQQSLPMDMKL